MKVLALIQVVFQRKILLQANGSKLVKFLFLKYNIKLLIKKLNLSKGNKTECSLIELAD